MLARVLVVAEKLLLGHNKRYTRSPRYSAKRPLPGGFDDPRAAPSRRGGSGVKPARAGLDRVERLLEPAAVGAGRAEPRRLRRAPRAARPSSPAVGRRSPRRGPPICSGARVRASPPSTAAGSPRWSRRAGCRRPGPASGRSRGGGRRAPSRSRSRRGSSRGRARRGRARRAPGRAPRRSARRRAARPSARPGWRTACRASRRRGRGRSSSWRAARASGWLVIASGSASTSAGRTRPPARSSAPAGRRWIAGHLGARHRRRDRRHAGAGDRGDRLRGVDHAPAAERDQAGRAARPARAPPRPLPGPPRRRPRGPRGARRRARAPPPARALGGEQLERVEAVLGEQRRGGAERPVAEDDGAPGVAPEKVARLRPLAFWPRCAG